MSPSIFWDVSGPLILEENLETSKHCCLIVLLTKQFRIPFKFLTIVQKYIITEAQAVNL